MSAFRKKPVVVEAVQVAGENWSELLEFTDGKLWEVALNDRGDDPDVIAEVYDKLHSTWVGVKLGQWIIRGVKGEFYPCDATVFAETYEPVEQ